MQGVILEVLLKDMLEISQALASLPQMNLLAQVPNAEEGAGTEVPWLDGILYSMCIVARP